jgi:hypothetical protein
MNLSAGLKPDNLKALGLDRITPPQERKPMSGLIGTKAEGMIRLKEALVNGQFASVGSIVRELCQASEDGQEASLVVGRTVKHLKEALDKGSIPTHLDELQAIYQLIKIQEEKTYA